MKPIYGQFKELVGRLSRDHATIVETNDEYKGIWKAAQRLGIKIKSRKVAGSIQVFLA